MGEKASFIRFIVIEYVVCAEHFLNGTFVFFLILAISNFNVVVVLHC